MDSAPTSLLAPDEPRPFTVTNEDGASPFVIICDHAGKYLPRRLQMLGLPESECQRHIAWDIGAGAVAACSETRSTRSSSGRITRASSSTATGCRVQRLRLSH